MASTETLTSLAMLKVRLDQGDDYLDYLRPFVLEVLSEDRPDPVTDSVVRDLVRERFGLEIPSRAIQLVLRRISRNYPLVRTAGVYRIDGEISGNGLLKRKAEAERHICSIVDGLIEFGRSTSVVQTQEDAVTALVAFLSEFSIPYLRAYMRGTAIPGVQAKHSQRNILVSQYVLDLHRRDPARFNSFIVLLQGHMLANSLLCPDLQQAPKSYKEVTFYLDTPLLVQTLGLEGELKQRASEELIRLLKQLGAKTTAFSHSREELERVIRGAAEHVEKWDGRGAIIAEARRAKRSRSDLLLIAADLDQRLKDTGIHIVPTPKYIADFQIDENAFAETLDDQISYFNPRAKEFDINSVRSIYVLRANTAPATLERAHAALVTSNNLLARAAYAYGQQHEATREVSSTITDFSLANMAWLKAPMGAPALPTTELLAYAYAALRPADSLLEKFLNEVEKLEKQGRISPREHQLLRSSTIAQEELMKLTLGNEDALTEETVSTTLERVTNEIKKEEAGKLSAETRAHSETERKLAEEIATRQTLQRRIYWTCQRYAQLNAWISSGVLFTCILLGIAGGLGLSYRNPWMGYALGFGAFVLAIVTAVSWINGTTARSLHEATIRRLRAWCLTRESKATGIRFDLEPSYVSEAQSTKLSATAKIGNDA